MSISQPHLSLFHDCRHNIASCLTSRHLNLSDMMDCVTSNYEPNKFNLLQVAYVLLFGHSNEKLNIPSIIELIKNIKISDNL